MCVPVFRKQNKDAHKSFLRQRIIIKSTKIFSKLFGSLPLAEQLNEFDKIARDIRIKLIKKD